MVLNFDVLGQFPLYIYILGAVVVVFVW
jgi:hypothetical protein